MATHDIKVYFTHISVENYEPGELIGLEKLLSVYEPVTHKVTPLAIYYDKETKELKLPRDISVPYLEKTFDIKATYINKPDPYDKLVLQLKKEPRDEHQRKAIAFLLGEENFEKVKRYSRLMLNLDTGIGKTYCAVAATALLQVKTAIIVHDNAIMERWKEGLLDYTNLSEKEIYFISGSKSIEKLMNKDKIKEKIFIISHRTILSYAMKNTWEDVHELFKKIKIGLKIFDEAHKELANIIKIDFFSNVERTFYLTATTMRSDHKENKIYETVFSKIPNFHYRISQKDANMKTTVLRYETNPSIVEKGKLKNIHGLCSTKYMDYTIFEKGASLFLRAINTILNTIKEREGKIAILVLTRRGAKFVKKYIEDNYPEFKDDVGLFTSDVSDKETKQKQLEKRVIVSTSKSFGTGVDIPELHFLINAEPYSSEVTARQVTGRLRNKGYYFEIIDNAFCKVQFEKRKKIIAEKSKSFNIFDLN